MKDMYVYRMAKPTRQYAANRIAELRKGRGWSRERLAAEMRPEVTMPTVQKLENGMMGLTLDYMISISAALGCAIEDLFQSVSDPVRLVPMIGSIAAGNWAEAVLDPIRTIPLPLDVGGQRCFALRPRGDSMDMIVKEDDGFIVVDPDQLDLIDRKLYAILNGDGEATFKQYRADPARLEPCSTNPTHKPIMVGREPFTVIGRVVFTGLLH